MYAIVGECQFTVTTDPVPGVNGYFPRTQNITLVCEVNEGGSRRATVWSIQTSLDREEGRPLRRITSGSDSNLLLSSQGTLGVSEIPDTTILTIVSLTEDLDATIIFCGFEEPLANFTIRIYCEYFGWEPCFNLHARVQSMERIYPSTSHTHNSATFTTLPLKCAH